MSQEPPNFQETINHFDLLSRGIERAMGAVNGLHQLEKDHLLWRCMQLYDSILALPVAPSNGALTGKDALKQVDAELARLRNLMMAEITHDAKIRNRMHPDLQADDGSDQELEELLNKANTEFEQQIGNNFTAHPLPIELNENNINAALEAAAEDEQDRLDALIAAAEDEQDRLDALIAAAEDEQDRLNALIAAAEDEQDRLDALIEAAAEDEQDRLDALIEAAAEDEQDRLDALIEAAEQEQDLFEAAIDAAEMEQTIAHQNPEPHFFNPEIATKNNLSTDNSANQLTPSEAKTDDVISDQSATIDTTQIEQKKVLNIISVLRAHEGATFGSLKLKPIPNLKAGISLNEKFLFIRELFANDPNAFMATVQEINDAPNLDIAQDLLQNGPITRYKWVITDEVTIEFLKLIYRRFV